MKKPQFSKVMVVITTILFVLTLIVCLGFLFLMSFLSNGQIVDYIVATTSLSVVAGIYGMVLKNYLSKSGLENCASIRNDSYKNIMSTRLEYIEGVIQLRQKYNVDQYTIDQIEQESPFDELSDSNLNQSVSKLDMVDSVNSEEPEIQHF